MDWVPCVMMRWMMDHSYCLLDRSKKCYGVPVNNFPGRVNMGEKTYPACGWHHPMNWVLYWMTGLKMSQPSPQSPDSVFLSTQIWTSSLTLLQPQTKPLLPVCALPSLLQWLYSQTVRQYKPFSFKLLLVRYLILAKRKVSNIRSSLNGWFQFIQSEQQFKETDPSLWETSALLLWSCGKRIKKTRAQIWNPPRAFFW